MRLCLIMANVVPLMSIGKISIGKRARRQTILSTSSSSTWSRSLFIHFTSCLRLSLSFICLHQSINFDLVWEFFPFDLLPSSSEPATSVSFLDTFNSSLHLFLLFVEQTKFYQRDSIKRALVEFTIVRICSVPHGPSEQINAEQISVIFVPIITSSNPTEH